MRGQDLSLAQYSKVPNVGQHVATSDQWDANNDGQWQISGDRHSVTQSKFWVGRYSATHYDSTETLSKYCRVKSENIHTDLTQISQTLSTILNGKYKSTSNLDLCMLCVQASVLT